MTDADDVRRPALALPDVKEIDSGGSRLPGGRKRVHLVLFRAQAGQAPAHPVRGWSTPS